jgi:hypothetical protein
MQQVFSDGDSENTSDDDEELSKTQLKIEFIVKFATDTVSGRYGPFSD